MFWRMGDLRVASTPALALLVARGVSYIAHEYEIKVPSGPETGRGARVAYGAAAAAFGAKRATLASTEAVQRATGSVPGGVSPIGTGRSMRTVIDTSAGGHAEILVSAGRHGLSVALTPRISSRYVGRITLCFVEAKLIE